ncbi:MAG: hypothetical protein HYS87_00080 [Candidatus Colwellbacteria bacterium]|nr:hypothetical protein [Candidatus Colwellbacteria bacterium]
MAKSNILIITAVIIVSAFAVWMFIVNRSRPDNLTEPPSTELTEEQKELLEKLRGTPDTKTPDSTKSAGDVGPNYTSLPDKDFNELIQSMTAD